MIRFTTSNDIEAVGRILKEWTRKEPDERIQPDSHFAVAQEDGELIGCAQLIVIDDPFWNRRWGLVENVYVNKGHRRQGVGEGLMGAIENLSRELGCEFIKLTSRKEDGRALYRALGYEESSAFRRELW